MATVTYGLETIDYQFQANSWEDGNQLQPDVLGLSNGGYVFAYNNVNISNGYILLDFYTPAGVNFGYSIPYVVDGGDTFGSTDAVGAPSLTQLSNDNVVVVWADANASSPGIRAAIFDELGAVVRDEFPVTPFSTDRLPQVTALAGGGFVATYQISGGTVLATIFNNAGTITTGEFTVNTTNGLETDAAITGLADGGFVATWTYDNAGSLEIRARLFDADGTPRMVDGSTNDFVVGAFGDNSQSAVAALPNGNWAVVYTDSGWATEDVGITLTIMRPNGEVVNSFAQVNDDTDPENELDPEITVLDNGFIVVSWTYPYNPGIDNDIYFRLFNPDGAPVSINGYAGVQVLDASFDNDVASAVSAIIEGQLVAAWQDSATDGASGQITSTVHELVGTIVAEAGDVALNGSAIRETITGNANGNQIDSGGGSDTMSGLGGNDAYYIRSGNETVVEGAGQGTGDWVATAVSYTLAAAAQVEYFSTLSSGGTGVIHLTSNGYGQTIEGNASNQTLTGNGGNDWLVGYAGRDTLWGGLQDDRFIFSAITHSGSAIGTADRIMDFRDSLGQQDLIDVHSIDANTTVANDQAFVLDTNGSFSTGEIRQSFINGGADLLLEFNNDADASSDMALVLVGITSVRDNADFLL